jgi:DNA-directed RNA polymerase subunit RPC12/RpoP
MKCSKCNYEFLDSELDNRERIKCGRCGKVFKRKLVNRRSGIKESVLLLFAIAGGLFNGLVGGLIAALIGMVPVYNTDEMPMAGGIGIAVFLVIVLIPLFLTKIPIVRAHLAATAATALSLFLFTDSGYFFFIPPVAALLGGFLGWWQASKSPSTAPIPQTKSSTRFSVARNGDVIGAYTKEEIQRYLNEGNLVPSDCYFERSKWKHVDSLAE